MIQTKENNSSTPPLSAPSPEQAWRASILLKHGEQIWQKVLGYYAQLQALPRQTRRRLQRKLGTTLMGAALLLALAGPLTPSAHAATITVGPGCTLVQAIQSANTDTAVGSCTTGSGADTIVLAGGTYSYTTLYASATALPTISSVITIEGNGATIARLAGSPDFRLLRVNSSGNLTLNNSTVTGGRTSIGGGISVNYGTLTLNNSTVSGNEAPTGGGIYGRGSFTLNNSTVTYNTATTGGGIATTGGTTIINDSTISNNTASNGSFGVGGGLDIEGTTTINRTTISGNTAFLRGGGLEVDTGDVLTLNNSTVSGNTATFGGGVSSYGTATLNNNTIVGNSATQPVTGAGGIFQYSGSMTLNRNIVAGNSAPVRVEIYRFGGTMNANNFNVLGHSGLTSAQAFSGFTPGASDINATSNGTNTPLSNILNSTLGSNGGPTLTHALVSGSPAIDIIATGGSICLPGTTADQRGAARANGVNSGGSACDAGAFEYASSFTPTAVSLSSFSASSPVGWIGLLVGLMGGMGTAVLHRRKR